MQPESGRVTRGDAAENAETERLFEEHSARLLTYCSRQLGSRSEAEDAVQTTFLYALRALRRGVVPECEVAWLTKIAKNVCNWQRRTRDRRGPLASDIDLDTIAVARAEGDEDGVLVGLKDALASIPENQRNALVLREWRGVPSREIAAQLGMSAPATHALLTRARRSLADALTVARRPALGLAWLAIELRSHVKALLGGVSAKATATAVTVAVVGAGVEGLAVERILDESKAQPRPVEAVYVPVAGALANASVVRVPRPSVRVSGETPENGQTARRVVPSGNFSTVTTVPVIGADEPQPSSELAGEDVALPAPPPAPKLPVELPAAPPQLPTVELPAELVSPLDVPTLPPVGLPTLPPVDMPSAPLPAADVPLPDLTLP